MKKLRSNQHYAIVVLVFSIVYLFVGFTTIKVNFFNGVIGPHHWVIGVAFCLMFFSILLFQPSDYQGSYPKLNEWFARIPFVIAIIVYAKILPYLGFILATPLLMTMIGYWFKAKPLNAFISAIVMTIACYLLFNIILGITLPTGLWFR